MSKARSSSERFPNMDPLGVIAAIARKQRLYFQCFYKVSYGGENHATKSEKKSSCV
jgi:hypothetical protein